MNPNGGTLTSTDSTNMYYSGYKRMYVTYNPSTKCQRVADSFTKNSTRGNGLSNYSVGLITADEIALAGGKLGTANGNFYLNTGATYWSSSSNSFNRTGNAYEFFVYSSGSLNHSNVNNAHGLRPVVSLKLGTIFASADGSTGNPYILNSNNLCLVCQSTY